MACEMKVEHASGDNNKLLQSTDMKENISQGLLLNTTNITNPKEVMEESEKPVLNENEITPKTIEEKDIKLKERIAHCKNLIESLKLELNEEKIRLNKESKDVPLHFDVNPQVVTSTNTYIPENINDFSDLYNVNIYSASVDSKLSSDENLMEYEKQLQRYQDTLNMAQIEKKNAIRKQMLAKAFKLKLMEVENQCNIELLRIKQNMQCLAPLQMIVEKWKLNSNENVYDLNNFELIPRYPELGVISGSDMTSISDDFVKKVPILNPNFEKNN